MGLFIRKRKKILPRVNLNVSKRGAGLSLGPRGAKVSVGPSGVNIFAGRGGVYYRKRLSRSTGKQVDPEVRRQASLAPKLIDEAERVWERGIALGRQGKYAESTDCIKRAKEIMDQAVALDRLPPDLNRQLVELRAAMDSDKRRVDAYQCEHCGYVQLVDFDTCPACGAAG